MQITFDRPGDPFQDRRLNRAQVVTPGQGDAEKSTRPRRQCGDLLNRCRSNAPPPERTLVQVPNCRIESYNSLTGAGLIRSLRQRVRPALGQKTNRSRLGRDDRSGSEVGLIRYRHRRILGEIAPVIAVGVLSTGDFWPLPQRDQRRPIDHARRPGHREDAFVLDT